MAIKARGEMQITLGKKSYTLTPSIEAILEMEEQAQMGIVSVADQFRAGNIGLKNMTAIIYGGLVGSGEIQQGKKRLSVKDISTLIRQQGIYKLSAACSEFLVQCLTGDQDEEPTEKGEEKAG